MQQIRKIPLLLIRGYSIKNIAEKYNISRNKIVLYFELYYKRDRFPVIFDGKHEPYYKNEDDYGKIPTYKLNSLSEPEKQLLNKQDE